MLGLHIGIDFGSANLTIFAEGKGIVLSEPSVVACDSYTGKPFAMGNAAIEMLGRTPSNLKIVNPIKDGVVNNYEIAHQMLRTYLNRICGNRLLKPVVLMCVPSTVTSLEKRTVLDVVTAAGAGRASFIEKPLAAALGSGVSIKHPHGSMIADFGGGTTDCGVVTMGSIAASTYARVGGNDITNSIINYLLREHGIEIGTLTAENIKKTVAGAIERKTEIAVTSQGKDIHTGLPVLFEVTSSEIYPVIKPKLEEMLTVIKKVLELIPTELLSDIMEDGIIMSGGGARMFGLGEFIHEATGVPARCAQEPELCVAKGMGTVIKDEAYLAENGTVYMTREDMLFDAAEE